MNSTAQHGPLYAPVTAEDKELRSAARVVRRQNRDPQTLPIAVCAAFATALVSGLSMANLAVLATSATAVILASLAFEGQSARRVRAGGVGVLCGAATTVAGMYAYLIYLVSQGL